MELPISSAPSTSHRNWRLNSKLLNKFHGPRSSPRLKPRFRDSLRIFASASIRDAESTSTDSSSVNPVYKPTPLNRELRTPHSGYHFDGSTRQFFEGWYFKVSIPECRQSFCFMYSVENPAFRKKQSVVEQATFGPRFTGVGAQILGVDDKYICQFSEDSQYFWGSRRELVLGNTFSTGKDLPPPQKEVPPQEFHNRVSKGFQVSPLWHQGSIVDDGRTDYVPVVKTARWAYSTRPVYGWGDVNSKQKSTAGWLAAFPVFEPHWQVCMAGGLSTGWIEWDGKLFEFENAPSYSEKNWGGAFPRKWFWVQCNAFQDSDGEVALTAAGGLRELPGLNTFENAALIGVHYNGIFYEFVPWNGTISWEIAPWGYWHMSAENKAYKMSTWVPVLVEDLAVVPGIRTIFYSLESILHIVELEATTRDSGTTLRAPTMEAGLAPACKDTCFGELRLQIWEKRYDGSKGKVVLDVTSNMAAVETGGGPWFNTWKGKTSSPELVNQALNLPVDVEGILSLVPLLKPPGL
ncbi:hypothetical protein Syun_025974 [Stephania yunnanensis]|uniref:Tocopherol cyclase n=1 Tax=Stephania yunnanensis TaxID=152371 RepID=A0AAP0ET45_9MAGN